MLLQITENSQSQAEQACKLKERQQENKDTTETEYLKIQVHILIQLIKWVCKSFGTQRTMILHESFGLGKVSLDYSLSGN